MTTPDVENDMALTVSAGVFGFDSETVLFYQYPTGLDIA